MKIFLLFISLLISTLVMAQVRIHAHNDYEKPVPLFNALSQKVYSIEADVFFRNGKLLVAHSAAEIDSNRTLEKLYIQPITKLFKQYKGRVSVDRQFTFTLMIDIKEGGEKTIAEIARILQTARACFDRKKNPLAVQVVISGDRGSIQNWINFPAFVFFDGRPNEQYDTATLDRVALVSDGYSSYAKNKEKLDAVINQTHQRGRLFRFWGTPDNESDWQFFRDSGVDIINTDKPEACRKYFESKK